MKTEVSNIRFLKTTPYTITILDGCEEITILLNDSTTYFINTTNFKLLEQEIFSDKETFEQKLFKIADVILNNNTIIKCRCDTTTLIVKGIHNVTTTY
jgi:hypothetical protein